MREITVIIFTPDILKSSYNFYCKKNGVKKGVLERMRLNGRTKNVTKNARD